jgi:hypothetical protein
VAQDHFQVRNRPERAQIRLLPDGLIGIVGPGIHVRGEVLDPLHLIVRKEMMKQPTQIQPPMRRPL